MRIVVSCPAPAGSRSGNRVTALRWAAFFRQLGHKPLFFEAGKNQPADLLVALHARKSSDAIVEFRSKHCGATIILALTGTDLHGDVREPDAARTALDIADRLVVLQPGDIANVPASFRHKCRTIVQSACPTAPVRWRRRNSSGDHVLVSLSGHFREEKDPFLVLNALTHLPQSSRIQVVHAGAALDDSMRQRAIAGKSSRYEWIGSLPRARARAIVAGSDLMLLTSRIEGGPAVISEAIVDGVPILATRIPSTEGLLGVDYSGLFPVGDSAALARLLNRFELDTTFRDILSEQISNMRSRFEPKVEFEAWRRLLSEVEGVTSLDHLTTLQ